MSSARGVPALFLAIAVAALALTLAPRLAASRPPVPWRTLDGDWKLDAARSRIPGRAGAPAGSLRVEAEPPLLVIREGEAGARTLWVGGPPVEAARGTARVTRVVSGSGEGVLVEETAVAGATRRETLRVEEDGGRLVRTVSTGTGDPGEVAVLVYERENGADAGGGFPALPVSAALAALALAYAAERGLPRRAPRESGVLAPAPAPAGRRPRIA